MTKVDPAILLLTGLLVLMIVALFASEIFFKSDSQFFQAIVGMATGVLGALLGLIQKKEKSQDVKVETTGKSSIEGHVGEGSS